jgi:Secretion system C-terminal sorting domain
MKNFTGFLAALLLSLSAFSTPAYKAPDEKVSNVSANLSTSSIIGVSRPDITVLTGNENHSIELSFASSSESETGILLLHASECDKVNLCVRIYDFLGQLLVYDNLETAETHISLQDLTSGSYFLKVCVGSRVLKSYEVIIK